MTTVITVNLFADRPDLSLQEKWPRNKIKLKDIIADGGGGRYRTSRSCGGQ